MILLGNVYTYAHGHAAALAAITTNGDGNNAVTHSLSFSPPLSSLLLYSLSSLLSLLLSLSSLSSPLSFSLLSMPWLSSSDRVTLRGKIY